MSFCQDGEYVGQMLFLSKHAKSDTHWVDYVLGPLNCSRQIW